MRFRYYLLQLTMLTAGCAVVLATVNYLLAFFSAFQFFSWLALLYFFLLTIITGWIALKGVDKNTGYGFVNNTNAIVMIKLFLSVIFIIVYAVIKHPDNIGFISSFFFFYVVYTVFEVRQVMIAQHWKDKSQRINE